LSYRIVLYNSHTHVPQSPSGIIWYTCQTAVMLCGWEGNRRSGIALVMSSAAYGAIKLTDDHKISLPKLLKCARYPKARKCKVSFLIEQATVCM